MRPLNYWVILIRIQHPQSSIWPLLQVTPNEIYGIEKREGSETTPALDEENAEEVNQETYETQYPNRGGKVNLSLSSHGHTYGHKHGLGN